MTGSIPARLLIRLCQASPETLAAVERILYYEGAGIGRAERGEGARRFSFRKAGSHWRVVFAGNPEFYLEDTLGARYLDYLLHHPNEPISAFDLEVEIQPEKAKARPKDSVQENADSDTIRSYLREIDELRGRRERAADEGRQDEIERLDEEIAQIGAGLKKGGTAADTGERARSNVNKSLALVRRRLAKGGRAEREFGQHIQSFVKVGYECMYAHPDGGCWE